MKSTVVAFAILLGSHMAALAASPSSIEAEVTTVVQDMASRWGTGQRHTIVRDLWDTADDKAMYLAGEQADWFMGTAPIEAYLGVRPNAPPSVSSYEVDTIRVRSLNENMALATWNLDYQFKRGTMNAMRERLRASAMLRKTPKGWKFFYYAESPKSSVTYLRELYESIVTPEFKAKVDASK